MSKENWVWMPHPGHLCVADKCRFFLSTYVNGYIVSTVGEYFPDENVRRLFLEAKIIFPIDENELNNAKKVLSLEGDSFNVAYLSIFGFEDIGADRKYETMVFKAKQNDFKCCPYVMSSAEDLDFEAYNTAVDAFKGHYELCEKWDKET